MKFDFSKVGKKIEYTGISLSGGSVEMYDAMREEAKHGSVGFPVLDFERSRLMVAAFDAEIERMVAEAEAFEVKSDDDAREATERAGAVKGLNKRIDERRKEIIGDPDSFVRKINQAVKSRRDRLDDVERAYKKKIADHAYRIELERRETIRKQEEERRRLQERIDAEAKAKGVESVEVAPVAIPAKQGPTRSDSATSSAVLVWDFEVVDPAAVPRPYLRVDEAAIRAAIKGGIREVPGVRIFERAEIRVRRVG